MGLTAFNRSRRLQGLEGMEAKALVQSTAELETAEVAVEQAKQALAVAEDHLKAMQAKVKAAEKAAKQAAPKATKATKKKVTKKAAAKG